MTPRVLVAAREEVPREPGRGVFVSYCHEDRAWAEALFEALKECGRDPWIDKKRLVSGTPLATRIASALDAVEFLAVVWSDHAHQSEWVRHELATFCAHRATAERSVLLFIVPGTRALPLAGNGWTVVVRALPAEPDASLGDIVGSAIVEVQAAPPAAVETVIAIRFQRVAARPAAYWRRDSHGRWREVEANAVVLGDFADLPSVSSDPSTRSSISPDERLELEFASRGLKLQEVRPFTLLCTAALDPERWQQVLRALSITAASTRSGARIPYDPSLVELWAAAVSRSSSRRFVASTWILAALVVAVFASGAALCGAAGFDPGEALRAASIAGVITAAGLVCGGLVGNVRGAWLGAGWSVLSCTLGALAFGWLQLEARAASDFLGSLAGGAFLGAFCGGWTRDKESGFFLTKARTTLETTGVVVLSAVGVGGFWWLWSWTRAQSVPLWGAAGVLAVITVLVVTLSWRARSQRSQVVAPLAVLALAIALLGVLVTEAGRSGRLLDGLWAGGVGALVLAVFLWLAKLVLARVRRGAAAALIAVLVATGFVVLVLESEVTHIVFRRTFESAYAVGALAALLGALGLDRLAIAWRVRRKSASGVRAQRVH